MAIAYINSAVVSRKFGSHTVARAAYRNGEAMTDQRNGETFDYSRREAVMHHEVVLPEHAPRWMADSEKLWNAVEERADLGRRVIDREHTTLSMRHIVALPKELSLEQQKALVRQHIHEEFTSRGQIADYAIHWDRDKVTGELRNPHAHIEVTMHYVDPKSKTGFGKSASNDWGLQIRTSPKTKEAILTSQGRAELIGHNQRWLDRVNGHLRMAGHDVQVSFDSNTRPEVKMGPKAVRIIDRIAEAEQRGDGKAAVQLREQFSGIVEKHEHNQAVRTERQTQALVYESKPEMAVTALKNDGVWSAGRLKYEFTKHGIEPERADQLTRQVLSSRKVVCLNPQATDTARVYASVDLVKAERGLANAAQRMRAEHSHPVSPGTINRVLASRPTIKADQEAAVRYLLGPERTGVVTGFAGSGKSFALGATREAWEAEGYRVQGIAPYGRQAEDLMRSAGIRSQTVKAFELGLEKGQIQLGPRDIVVIEEGALAGAEQAHKVIKAIDKAGAAVKIVGDNEQQQSIDGGAFFRVWKENAGGGVSIETIQRQREGWQREASVNMGRGQTRAALDAYDACGGITGHATDKAALDTVVNEWARDRVAHPNDSQLMLAFRRKDVEALNQRARAIRVERGELRNSVTFSTERGQREFAVGDRLYFLENDNHGRRVATLEGGTSRDVGVKNGTLGRVERIHGNAISVRLDPVEKGQAGRLVQFDATRYRKFDHGYASTVPKEQGATADRVYVFGDKFFDRHRTYVALTRHRVAVSLHWSQDQFRDKAHLFQRLSRAGLKRSTLDYAEARGINIEPARIRAVTREWAAEARGWIGEQRAKVEALWQRATERMQQFRTEVARRRPATFKPLEKAPDQQRQAPPQPQQNQPQGKPTTAQPIARPAPQPVPTVQEFKKMVDQYREERQRASIDPAAADRARQLAEHVQKSAQQIKADAQRLAEADRAGLGAVVRRSAEAAETRARDEAAKRRADLERKEQQKRQADKKREERKERRQARPYDKARKVAAEHPTKRQEAGRRIDQAKASQKAQPARAADRAGQVDPVKAFEEARKDFTQATTRMGSDPAMKAQAHQARERMEKAAQQIAKNPQHMARAQQLGINQQVNQAAKMAQQRMQQVAAMRMAQGLPLQR